MTGANEAQREAWNGEHGQRWVADPDRRDRLMTAVADALLEAASLQAGERVLDIGCGCGATTLAAANAVEAGGSAHGVDLSELMLEVARGRAAARGIGNASFEQADAQTQPFAQQAYDVAMSRFGTMFFDDPVAAFANVRSALAGGGRLCMATWQPLVANDWLTIPGAELLRFGTLPEAGGDGPGMFALSEQAVVRRILEQAGFTSIDVAPVVVPLHLGDDAAEAAAALADSGPGRAVLDTIPIDRQPVAIQAVTDLLATLADDSGISLNGAILVTTASAPPS